MKYIVTFLLAALSLNAIAQINPNYNPDYDANGVIGVDDLLGILSTFGDTWDSGDDCGIPVPHEGYQYSTVLIGDQCWFSENCRYLPEVSDPSINSTNEPHYSVYGYTGTEVTAAQATANYATYGVL